MKSQDVEEINSTLEYIIALVTDLEEHPTEGSKGNDVHDLLDPILNDAATLMHSDYPNTKTRISCLWLLRAVASKPFFINTWYELIVQLVDEAIMLIRDPQPKELINDMCDRLNDLFIAPGQDTPWKYLQWAFESFLLDITKMEPHLFKQIIRLFELFMCFHTKIKTVQTPYAPEALASIIQYCTSDEQPEDVRTCLTNFINLVLERKIFDGFTYHYAYYEGTFNEPKSKNNELQNKCDSKYKLRASFKGLITNKQISDLQKNIDPFWTYENLEQSIKSTTKKLKETSNKAHVRALNDGKTDKDPTLSNYFHHITQLLLPIKQNQQDIPKNVQKAALEAIGAVLHLCSVDTQHAWTRELSRSFFDYLLKNGDRELQNSTMDAIRNATKSRDAPNRRSITNLITMFFSYMDKKSLDKIKIVSNSNIIFMPIIHDNQSY